MYVHSRKLHCRRNSIHLHCFISFFFRALLCFTETTMFMVGRSGTDAGTCVRFNSSLTTINECLLDVTFKSFHSDRIPPTDIADRLRGALAMQVVLASMEFCDYLQLFLDPSRRTLSAEYHLLFSISRDSNQALYFIWMGYSCLHNFCATHI